MDVANGRGRWQDNRVAHAVRRRPTEVWTLVALNLLTSGTCFVAAYAPLTARHIVVWGIVLGLIFLAVAVALWICAFRVRPLGLVFTIGLNISMISAIAAQARDAESAALVSYLLVWSAIYAASFLDRLKRRAVLVLIALGSLAALAADSAEHSPAIWIILNATTVTASLVIGRSADRLRHEAETDDLTGVLNRRGFMKAAVIEHSISARADLTLSVTILDLDDFKAVNDAAGHAGGDRLLIEAAASWRRELRVGDLLSRYGGDEFVVLSPVRSADEVEALLTRLRLAYPINWTAGTALWENDEELESCLGRADAALYAQKLRRRIG